ncbi:FkbM family methyltransferase [Niveispirillum sp. KHB5.9]|uniref:FkbM family methyltransferase n=1 Tax=Niveispirillum sp. KHB5.9 TaxID=3400269 RepID=UPI003A854B1A
MACDERDLIQNCIIHFGVWEPEVSAQFEASIRPGDVVVDIGANVGFFTLLAAHLTGSTGAVIAIEASPRIAALLQDNVDMNAPLPVSVRNVAVADKRGEVTIYDGPASNIGRTTILEGRGFDAGGTVPALPIDEILSKAEAHSTAFIKIDIEGAERPVLEHILAHLDRFPNLRHVLVEASVEDGPDAWHAIFQRFTDAGFRAGAIENQYSYAWYLNWTRPQGLVPISRLPDTQTDVLFSRDPPAVMAEPVATKRARTLQPIAG